MYPAQRVWVRKRLTFDRSRTTVARMIHLLVSIVAMSITSLSTPTVDDVLAMMSRVPNECELFHSCPKDAKGAALWGLPNYERLNDAREIAEAIVAGVRVESDPWRRAALGVVYAAFESNNRRCAEGDGGKSWGAWQQQGLSRDTACTPMRAFPMWLAMVKQSESACGDLALVASGSCDRGRDKVRRRNLLASGLLGTVVKDE